MKFKQGVTIFGVRPEIVAAMFSANAAFFSRGYEFVVTSVTDGVHSRGSLHYQGAAFDVRTRHVDEDDLEGIVDDIKDSLTAEFDVVLESTHIHIEFQPKK